MNKEWQGHLGHRWAQALRRRAKTQREGAWLRAGKHFGRGKEEQEEPRMRNTPPSKSSGGPGSTANPEVSKCCLGAEPRASTVKGVLKGDLSTGCCILLAHLIIKQVSRAPGTLSVIRAGSERGLNL